MKELIHPGDIISYFDMCQTEGYSLQRGMNFRVNEGVCVFLMSLRKGAPYADRVEENGQILIYEGHDAQKNWARIPKEMDQPMYSPAGTLTENGKFYEVAQKCKKGLQNPEPVKVYEKIKDGIWVYNGVFDLLDSWLEDSDNRKVFKFKLKITDETSI